MRPYGRFFATRAEIDTFPAALKPKLLVAELAFETERYDDARARYASLRKEHGGRLNANALAYLDYHEACALLANDRARALAILEHIAAMGPKTPTWSRAKLDLFVLTQTLDADGGGALRHLDDLIAKLPGTSCAMQAAYVKASFLVARRRFDEARPILAALITSAPGTWIATGSERKLAECSR